MRATFVLSALFVSAPLFARSGDRVAPAFDAEWNSALHWRAIGPANMGGRIVALAVVDDDPSTYWVGTASGGLLKTTNRGITYEHQFDHEETVSVGDVALAPSDPSIVWVGTGEANPRNSVSYGDGVYKSTDGGATWRHKGLDDSFQIGRIVVHPTDPNVVYVGALGRLYGPSEERGLYKTTDGGETWERILYVDASTGVIDVDVHPSDPDTLIVATYERQRDLYDSNDPAKKWGPGSGLHKTTDGGKTWRKLAAGLPEVQLGRIGVDWYRKDPNVLFAVIETERIARLPDDAAYLGVATEDAEIGARVRRVAEGSPAEAAGLAEQDIVLAIGEETVLTSDALSRALYRLKAGDKVALEYVREKQLMRAEIELAPLPEDARDDAPFSSGLGGQRENVHEAQGRGALDTGGVFKSTDGGESWTRINSLNPRPMYFSQIRVDPSDERYVYVLGIQLHRSEDGGATFTNDGHGDDVHVDHHALWIDPADGRHMILGNDGGLYVTYDRMRQWDHHNHMAIGQFYHVAVDATPSYKVYGGLQDNGTWGGPSRIPGGDGPVNADWIRIGGGDGFVCAVDPDDPDLVYYESQNGGLGRAHLTNGDGGFMRPRGIEDVRYRFNWRTPFVLSSHNPRIYYAAANYVFRSLDRGRELEPISPRITRTEDGSATALAESRHAPGTIYAGTDDGALWRSTDFGVSWTDLFDLDGSSRTLAQELELREKAAAEQKAAEAASKAIAATSEAAAGDDAAPAATVPATFTSGEPAEAVLAAAEAAVRPADAIAGEWKGKLVGDGIPAEGAELRLLVARDAAGAIAVELSSAKISARSASATFDERESTLTAELASDAGRIQLVARVEARGGGEASMRGKLSVAGGLFELSFEATRAVADASTAGASGAAPGANGSATANGAGAAAAPAQDAAPRDAAPAERDGARAQDAAAPAADPVAGTWEAELVGDDVPSGGGFTITLARDAEGELGGSTSSSRGEGKVESARYDRVSGELALVVRSDRGTFDIEGKITGETMRGTLVVGGGAFSMEFEARRTKAPAASAPPAADASAPKALAASAPVETRATEAARDAVQDAAVAVEASARDASVATAPPLEAETAAPPASSLAALLPVPMCVASIEPSHHERDRVYAAFDGHRSDDDAPWLFVSEDAGEEWASLGADLPRGSARVLREDPVNPDLLYLGTEFGAWISIDRGASWTKLTGEFPTVAVHEFAFSPAVPEVVLATHGRSLWVLDVSALRQMTEEVREADAWLFRPDTVVRARRAPERGASGTRRFVGDNVEQSASIYYLLRERAREVKLSITDPAGEVLRELEASADRGLHRVAWDLRRAARSGERGSRGRSLPEGSYRIVLEVDGERLEQTIAIEDPHHVVSEGGRDRDELDAHREHGEDAGAPREGAARIR